MIQHEDVSPGLHGIWRDVITGPDGQVSWDSGWRKNAIVLTCRNLLAGFMAGQANTSGIFGLAIGSGLASWDLSNPPTAQPSQTALVDTNYYTVPKAQLDIAYLNGGVVSGTPTNKLQIRATLGPGIPTWPDGNHATISLREFGLLGTLNNSLVLINYVTHPVINKDPASTLQRTLWLTF